MMALSFEAQAIPLQEDSMGTIRVGKTRVRLESVVYAFNQGYSAEEIMSKYPTLDLADVYAVVAYYLNHREAVDEYIHQKGQEAAELRQEIEAHTGHQLLRERLLTRRQELQKQTK
jgi:uncharacterized protein (DUF433 family)